MYIWGGGWNKADTGAGTDGLRIGLNASWRKFCAKQKASYNYRKHRFAFGNGLDCSGFVGWSVYNINKTKMENRVRVMLQRHRKQHLLMQSTAGEPIKDDSGKGLETGDIMSSPTHIYIVVGSCADGSVVLVHSSPAGVRLSGTPDKKGRTNSEAVKLAKKYMKKYYPSWYKRYPSCKKIRVI